LLDAKRACGPLTQKDYSVILGHYARNRKFELVNKFYEEAVANCPLNGHIYSSLLFAAGLASNLADVEKYWQQLINEKIELNEWLYLAKAIALLDCHELPKVGAKNTIMSNF
jgi:hypothetical protein